MLELRWSLKTVYGLRSGTLLCDHKTCPFRAVDRTDAALPATRFFFNLVFRADRAGYPSF